MYFLSLRTLTHGRTHTHTHTLKQTAGTRPLNNSFPHKKLFHRLIVWHAGEFMVMIVERSFCFFLLLHDCPNTHTHTHTCIQTYLKVCTLLLPKACVMFDVGFCVFLQWAPHAAAMQVVTPPAESTARPSSGRTQPPPCPRSMQSKSTVRVTALSCSAASATSPSPTPYGAL